MSNNFYQFKIPYFNEKYGSDWDSFTTVINDNVDYVMNKTYQLYWLFDPNYYTTRVAEAVSDSLEIDYTEITTLAVKKYNIRKFLTKYANKGLADTYLDVQEAIVGTRGVIYTGYQYGWKHHTTSTDNNNRWGSATSGTFGGAFKWTKASPQFYIYIDAKTTDSGLLDLLVEEYRQPSMLPAFYQIYIVDSSNNLLRTV